ncbi:MAG: HlyD family secretion protein [Bacteroidales bacterium]|nr:HlyD family secretion protein [Bacteroidales bacterium]
MNKRKIIILISIIVIIVGAISLMMYFMSFKELPAEKNPENRKIFIKASPVVYNDIIPVIKEGGRLGSNHNVDVISEVQGEILKGNIPLKKGQSFKQGDLLIRIFDEETKYNLKAGKSRFLNTIANALPDFNIDFPDNYKNWMNFFNSIEIDKPLPELPKIISSQEKTFLSSRNILNDYFIIKSSEVRLEKYSIYAPFNGAYTDVFLEVGSIANPGIRIAKIIRTDKLELEIPIKVDEINLIRIGDKVKITTENSNNVLEGTIVRIADFVNPQTQSISVFINVNQQDDMELYEGLYLLAEFDGKHIKNVMEMPRNAVFNFNEVFIVENGKLVKRNINIHKINEKTLIFSGLDEGVKLVVVPLVNVQEGDEVKIIK